MDHLPSVMLQPRYSPLADPPSRAILTVFIVIPLAASILALALSVDTAEWFMSEAGPLEQLSPILWIVLAVFAVGLFGFRNLTAWATFTLALAAGLREWGLHKSLTDYSMLKIGFYFKESQPIETRLICGAIVLTIGLSAALLIVRSWQQFRKHSLRSLPSWAWIMLMAIAALVISKMFDRSQAILEDTFHFNMHERTALVIRAIEESTEMLLPLAFAAAMLCLALSYPRHKDAANTTPT